MTPVLADASFFVAFLNLREASHDRCLQAYQEIEGPIYTCEACLAEAFHLLHHAGAAVDAILTNIRAGALEVPFRLTESAGLVADLMRKYADTPCNFADACLIAMADQLGTGEILTLDGDFTHYRWRRTRRFRLLIPLD